MARHKLQIKEATLEWSRREFDKLPCLELGCGMLELCRDAIETRQGLLTELDKKRLVEEARRRPRENTLEIIDNERIVALDGMSQAYQGPAMVGRSCGKGPIDGFCAQPAEVQLAALPPEALSVQDPRYQQILNIQPLKSE